MTKKEMNQNKQQISMEETFYCPICARDNPENKNYHKFHKFVKSFDGKNMWVGCGCGFRTSKPQKKSPEETTKRYV